MKVAPDPCPRAVAQLRRDIRIVDACHQCFQARHGVFGQLFSEFQIFGPSGHVLGNRQIVHLKAQANDSVCIWGGDSNEPVAPASRQNCGALVHALGVVAIFLVKA